MLVESAAIAPATTDSSVSAPSGRRDTTGDPATVAALDIPATAYVGSVQQVFARCTALGCILESFQELITSFCRQNKRVSSPDD